MTERKRAEWTARALARIGHELFETLDPARVADRIVTTVFERLPAVRVNLYLLGQGSRALSCVATAGEGGPGGWLGTTLPPAESLTARTIADGRWGWSSDVLADPRVVEPAWVLRRLLEEGCGPAATFPLAARGRVLGALALACSREQTLAPRDFKLLTVFADHAAVALENARIHRKAEDRAQRLATLSLLTRLIGSAQGGPAVFNAIAEAAVSFLGARGARVCVADPKAQVLRALGSRGADLEAERLLLSAPILPYGIGIPGRIFETGQPEYIADSYDDPRWVDAPFVRALGVRGYAGLPLIAGGRVLGVLSVLFEGVKEFTDEDKELISLLAGQAAIAISNTRLYEDAERRGREAEALAGLASDVNASLDLTTIFKRVAEKAREMFGADISGVALRGPGADSVTLRYWSGPWGKPDHATLEAGKGIGKWVLATGLPFRTDDYAGDPRIAKDHLDAARAEKIVTAMVVPITGEGVVEGLLYVENRSPRPFTDQDETMATRMAVHAAVAIRNARLHEQERQARGAAEASREALRRVSARLVEAQEAERREIARELHDEIGQLLTGLKLTLEPGARAWPAAARRRLGEAQAQIRELMERVREMSLDLRPAMLDDLGLVPALVWHLERYTAQTKIRVAFKHAGIEGRRFAPPVETAAYRIVQESLTNVGRHSGADEATVRVWVAGTALGVQVEDAGAGFDPQDAARGYTGGLSGMRERALSVGGDFTIDTSPGGGTRVICELPATER